MYTVTVLRSFSAGHFLIGGDWGVENDLHQHNYKLECSIRGRELNAHGYLVDIVEVEQAIDMVLQEFAEKVLNHLLEFQGLNPSLEHFCRILAHKLAEQIQPQNSQSLCIKLWENEFAWASYETD